MTISWHLVTGEYPPKPGGVSDYTALVARGLVEAGDAVHVWTRGTATAAVVENGVTVHRTAGTFGPLSLRRLSRELNQVQKPRRLFVQYVPYAFGWKAMNLPFALWVWSRRRFHGDDVRTLFHEVWFPWVRRPLKHNLLAAVHRVMAFFVARGSRTCYVSTTAWEPLVKSVHATAVVTWLPVPASIVTEVDAAAVTAFRRALPAGPVVAHFGTYGHHIADLLTPTLDLLFKNDLAVTVLLLGRDSDTFRQSLLSSHPEWAARLVATGALPSEEVAVALRACDVALQPYPDGASTRRTSLMAVLANGVPVVTTLGRLSESLWAASGLPVAAADDPAGLVRRVTELLTDELRRNETGSLGRRIYEERFSLGKTIETLRLSEGFIVAK